MENQYYKMMIANARAYIDTFNPTKDESDRISIFQISETLAICTGKLKEDIVADITNCNRELSFVERVNLFFNIWSNISEDKKYQPVAVYYDVPTTHPDFEKTFNYISRDELYQYIIDGTINKLYESHPLVGKLNKIMNCNGVPKRINEIQYHNDNTYKHLNEYK